MPCHLGRGQDRDTVFVADGITATVWQGCACSRVGATGEAAGKKTSWEGVISDVLTGGSPVFRPWPCDWVPGLGLLTLLAQQVGSWRAYRQGCRGW